VSLKLMLVDDNPLVLDLMRRGLEPHANVEAIGDGADALVKALESPPDLIICDYRMEGLDGRQLIEKLKSKPQTQKVPMVLLASKSDVDERLQGIADQVEDFFIKPFFIRDLTKRAKRILDRIYLEKMQREASAMGGGITGRLAEMGVMDLFPTLEQGQKTCALIISGPDGKQTATIYFENGQIHHAVMDNIKGDAVINHIVHWSDGAFQIDFNARSAERTTTTGTQGLLMDALRMLDEENK
jgi:CheY-like chemotaxis protein